MGIITEEKLNNLIRIFHEKELIKKIRKAKDCDRIRIYQKEKQAVSKELTSFKDVVIHMIGLIERNNGEGYIIGSDYDISPEDALEICLICRMTGIENTALFDNTMLSKALRQIKGDLVDIAKNFADFIDDEQTFRYYDDEQFLKKLFN